MELQASSGSLRGAPCLAAPCSCVSWGPGCPAAILRLVSMTHSLKTYAPAQVENNIQSCHEDTDGTL